jgi:hypothetical protein
MESRWIRSLLAASIFYPALAAAVVDQAIWCPRLLQKKSKSYGQEEGREIVVLVVPVLVLLVGLELVDHGAPRKYLRLVRMYASARILKPIRTQICTYSLPCSMQNAAEGARRKQRQKERSINVFSRPEIGPRDARYSSSEIVVQRAKKQRKTNEDARYGIRPRPSRTYTYTGKRVHARIRTHLPTGM